MENTDRTSFWEKLPKPFFVLAPMADVTDVAFRSMFAKYGKPDVFWTEFVSADGLCSPGRESLKADLLFEENQRPIVAQLFTANTEHMYQAGKYVKELGFDGLDINMGCPDRSIEKQGSGAALIRTPEIAVKIIAAAQKTKLPVSVKTRIGYNREEIDQWLPALLKNNIKALTVHLRTRKEMSQVPAHWEYMNRIIKLRNAIAPNTLIIGNGDVNSMAEAEKQTKETGCDGIMIGRGIFGTPWFFNKNMQKVSPQERLQMLVEHTKLFEEKLPMKHFHIMKKHYKAYINDFDGAKELRTNLMNNAENARMVEEQVNNFLKTM